MSIFIPRSIVACSMIAGLAALPACSEKKGANVSFQDIDRSDIPANIIENSDLSESRTEWTGWHTGLVDENGSHAVFNLEPSATDDTDSLKVSVINVEADSAAEEIHAGPSAVPVTPGQAYGVGAFIKGPTCGIAKFVVHEGGEPDHILAEQEVFLSGEWQSVDYYFEVPDGVESVDLPAQLALSDNIGGDIFLNRFIAIPTVMPPPQEEGNVVHNSSFELSDTDINVRVNNQDTWSQSGEAATFTLDTTVAQDGNNSVRIDFGNIDSGNPWDTEAGPANIAVTDGWTYTFSAWVKGEEGGRVNFLVQQPDNYTIYNEQAVEVTPEWQEVRFEARITDTNVVRLYAQYHWPQNANKTIYIDNFKLIPPDVCPYLPIESNLVSDNEGLFEYNHVINGGLEEDGTAHPGWTAQVDGAAQAEFDIQTVEEDANRSLVNSGNRSLKTTITAASDDAWDIQAGPSDLIVVPGQTYIYSAFARGAANTQASFTAALEDSPYEFFEEQVVTLNNLWQQITFDFTVPADAPLLTEDELADAELPSDAVVTRIRMAANLSFPENVGKRIFLDDFTLLPTAIANGSLENSTTEATGWTWQAANELANVELDSTEAHTGNNSLRVDIAEIAEDAVIDLWDIQAGIADIPVVGGRKYYVSTRIKGSAAARVKILLDSAESPFDEYGSVGGEDADEDSMPDGFAVTENWQEITFEAHIPEGVEAVRLLAQLGFTENSNQTVYLDSFRVVSQVPQPTAETANRVSNGGLENGESDGWNASGPDVSIAVTTSAEGVYSGNFGLHVTDRTDNWHSAQYSLLNAGLEESDRYQASAWVKVDGDTEDNLKLTLYVMYEDGTEGYISISETGSADTLGWTQLHGFFDVPEGDIADIRIYIEAVGEETSYYIDDLFITKVFTPNGDLELGDTTGWDSTGPAQATVSMDEMHTGSYSLHVTGRQEDWNAARFDLLNAGMQPGRSYEISAWVKIDGETADTLKMTIEKADEGDDTFQYLTIAESSDTLDWVKLSNTYTYAPDGEATAFNVYFQAEGHTSAYYIDDLVITEVIPPVNLITNGDLEYGRTDGWVNGGDAKLDLTTSADEIHSGNFALHVTERTARWNSAQFGLLEAGLVEGASYLASAWVKVDDTAGTEDTLALTLEVAYEESDLEIDYIHITGATVDTDWTKLSGMVSYEPQGTVTDVKIYIEAEGDTTDYFIDDLIIQRMYAPNGDLEADDDNPTGWNANGGVISVVMDEQYSGTNSLYITDRTVDWNSAQYDLLNSGMEAGKTYDLSAWVKIEGSTADRIGMTIELSDDRTDTLYLPLAASEDTVDWVELRSRYTYAPDGTATAFKVYFEAADVDSSYYIDDLVITEVNESD